MDISCPHCRSFTVRKNGSIHSGKQKYEVGKRNKASGEALMKKLPNDLKKMPSFIQISSQFTMKLSNGHNTVPLAKNLGRQVTLNGLIARSDNDVQG